MGVLWTWFIIFGLIAFGWHLHDIWRTVIRQEAKDDLRRWMRDRLRRS